MSHREAIPIALTDGPTVEGDHPLIIIGPNGSGKTRYGLGLVGPNKAQFVAALRNISLPDSIPRLAPEDAENQLANRVNRHRGQPWHMSNEIDVLFSKLLAEDAASAVRFRNETFEDKSPHRVTTNLMRLQTLWHELFPGMSIDLSRHTPHVTASRASTESTYSANQMSDGERAALYLGAKILSAPKGIVVVDEPEVHFHSRLAVKLWDKLETLRPDVRFVYITHDLSFALSRRAAQFLILRVGQPPQLVPLDTELPSDLSETILGAATFSIHARHIVFCESREGNNGDHSLYSAWFSGPDAVVMPVGSCTDVVRCTQAFSETALVQGVTATGIIDRDYWPEDYLSSLVAGVFALPVHEIENLYCLRIVFLAVAKHLGLPNNKAVEAHARFLEQARSLCGGDLFAKQLSERFKRRCERLLEKQVRGIRIPSDGGKLREEHIRQMDVQNWGFDPETVYDEEESNLTAALTGDETELHKYFPGKSMIGMASKALDIGVGRYRDLVDTTLASTDTSSFKTALTSALRDVLPERKHSPR